MIIRKILLIVLLTLFNITVLAGEKVKETKESKAAAEEAQQPEAAQLPHIGVYIDTMAGYGFADWSGFTNDGHGAWALIGGINPSRHKKSGFSYGANIGYHFIRYLGLEFGYYNFAKISGDNLELETPYVYAAGKLSYPFLANDDLAIFAKLGMAYRMLDYGGNAQQGAYQNKRYSINLLYGVGAQYYLSQGWRASVQWLEIPKYTQGEQNSKKSSKQVPRTDQILFGLGYLFSV